MQPAPTLDPDIPPGLGAPGTPPSAGYWTPCTQRSVRRVWMVGRGWRMEDARTTWSQPDKHSALDHAGDILSSGPLHAL
ncbi:hypothetical protein Hypma_004897 [Hypsizygus marmoreus]|uniref:Uncharacterized protein n=1 Tax=Hypsizygus marmoreus TaxID=39966 RepID=A0A369KBC7_HYPMA|nr:hypothetical protein Hypma_004897 [Hypsizygus marmoreus]